MITLNLQKGKLNTIIYNLASTHSRLINDLVSNITELFPLTNLLKSKSRYSLCATAKIIAS